MFCDAGWGVVGLVADQGRETLTSVGTDVVGTEPAAGVRNLVTMEEVSVAHDVVAEEAVVGQCLVM